MKENIIPAARAVFTQKGLHQTTLRDIAQQVGISDGHLRYYFKTKEELILATFGAMEAEIAALTQAHISGSTTVQSLVGALTGSFRVLLSYGFFFTESPAQLAHYSTVYVAYQQLIRHRKALFLALFEQYQRAGIFTEAVDAALFPLLYEQFFILSDSWIRHAYLSREAAWLSRAGVEHYVALCLTLLLPYLNRTLGTDVSEWVKAHYDYQA